MVYNMNYFSSYYIETLVLVSVYLGISVSGGISRY